MTEVFRVKLGLVWDRDNCTDTLMGHVSIEEVYAKTDWGYVIRPEKNADYIINQVSGFDTPDAAKTAFEEYYLSRLKESLVPVEGVVMALDRLIKTAKLLHQNAVGCAMDHHGADFYVHGLPGWLSDCQADIAYADTTLASLQENGGGE